MTIRHAANPIIRTGTHAILKEAATAALETAQLAIARGPAGIGKSFALTLLEKSMTRNEDTVLVFTATARNGRSVKRFFEEAIIDLGIIGYGGTDPMQRIERVLMQSFPFRAIGPRVLFVIDECQHLDAKLIECLRGLFDLGRYARDFDLDKPAFGLLLVGNGHFLARGGKAERAAFEALLSRCPIEVTLDRPTRDEIHELAASFFGGRSDLKEALAAHGERFGNLRVMDTAVDMARHFAGGGNEVSLAHLQKAFLFSAGGKA